ncbi:hypothetical protein SY89_02846 [Halolamina pelagica]|uniref:Uncharacterized protein n=1 Tax=Halolamina pelagica TaxID=699431 RepID=A0A0P7HY52_9EURY|nr:hypothetical protein SY89_02846 [Halolamina pelagica]
MSDWAAETDPAMVSAPVGWICSTFWTSLLETMLPMLARMSVASTTASPALTPTVVVPVFIPSSVAACDRRSSALGNSPSSGPKTSDWSPLSGSSPD